jgi:hypothetical protein
MILNVQCTGDAESIARNLRKLAEQLEKGDKSRVRNCGMRAFVREEAEESVAIGEHAIDGRFYAVCLGDDGVSEPFVLFRKQNAAEDFANEFLHDFEICRVDLFGSLYDGLDNDPHVDGF